MSKLGSALYEIHHMDTIAERDQWVNHIHPLVKLVLTVAYIAACVSFSKYDLTGILRMGIYLIVVFILGDISFQSAEAENCIAAGLFCGSVQSVF